MAIYYKGLFLFPPLGFKMRYLFFPTQKKKKKITYTHTYNVSVYTSEICRKIAIKLGSHVRNDEVTLVEYKKKLTAENITYLGERRSYPATSRNTLF